MNPETEALEEQQQISTEQEANADQLAGDLVAVTGSAADGGREQRVAHRKARIEQNRLLKNKPLLHQDGLMLLM